MLKKLFGFLLIVLISLQLNGNTYYISSSGNDANNGSLSLPWKTLSYACSQAIYSNDIIHINSGTYNIDQSCYLSVGVSIEGEGLTSHLTTSVINAPTIIFNSTEDTQGNQHVSGIQIDGNNLANCTAILINNRSNVQICDCSFINFKLGASYHATENPYEYIIEIRNSSGGIAIYHNTIEGGIRAFSIKQSEYSYSLDIHHNTIGKGVMDTIPEVGIYVYDVEGLITRNNFFKNLAIQIDIVSNSSSSVKNIFIFDNVMFNIGVATNDWYGSGIIFDGATTEHAQNILIANNTIIANPSGRNTRIGIYLPCVGYATGVSIQNNIMEGFNYATIFAAGPESIIDTISIENNIFWKNIDTTKSYCTSDSVYYTNIALPLNQTNENNLFTDPLFISSDDFHLSNNSPAIGAGIQIPMIIYDYDDKIRNNVFDIGAYMYETSTNTNVPKEEMKILIYPVPFKDHFTIVEDNLSFTNANIEIYNIQGVIIYENKLTDTIFDVYLGNIPPGIYFVRLVNSSKMVITAKIVKY